MAGSKPNQDGQKLRIDSWFIGFAAVENPKIAWTVMVEKSGYGPCIAVPIAGNLLLKADNLDLLNPPQPQASLSPQRNANH